MPMWSIVVAAAHQASTCLLSATACYEQLPAISNCLLPGTRCVLWLVLRLVLWLVLWLVLRLLVKLLVKLLV